MTEVSIDKTPKYQFWLALVALLMSGFFGVLGLGTFTIGHGLAEDLQGANQAQAILVFNLIGILFLVLTPTCLWLAWKFRPGGK